MTTREEKAATLEEIEAVFLALAHESRRHIVLVLSHLGGELPSGYLATRFQHSWPTTTRHLGVLEKAGVIHVRREGRTSLYRVDRELLQRVVGGWLQNLVPIGPEQTWRSQGPKSTRALARSSTPQSKREKRHAREKTHRKV